MKPVNERALDFASLIGIIWRAAYDHGREDVEKGSTQTPKQAWETYGFFDENACRLRRGLYDFADDVARVDYLAQHHPNLAAQISRNAISTPSLREAIDRDIEEKTALPL